MSCLDFSCNVSEHSESERLYKERRRYMWGLTRGKGVGRWGQGGPSTELKTLIQLNGEGMGETKKKRGIGETAQEHIQCGPHQNKKQKQEEEHPPLRWSSFYHSHLVSSPFTNTVTFSHQSCLCWTLLLYIYTYSVSLQAFVFYI
ncbi:hypothetical protein CHARACLAT_029932 [Characodon lateralis]|uniref:Uncharacterized protein n=1 Tax=Characodon lateralis TaxID=208331 RepID=A0ABU7EPM0_9TELE|nr:hypothetical protein [Characodon lateralis]